MNLLKTYTYPTELADSFLVYWANSPLRAGGLLKVRVLPRLADPQIAAELAALQYLLEEKQVLGCQLSGNANTSLIVSQGAIRKLLHRKSDKAQLAPYANFLTTRFAGCKLAVAKDTRWFAGFIPDAVDDLLVGEPRREQVNVTGVGAVSVTQHVLDRYAHRFLTAVPPDKLAQAAWKNLSKAATDPALQEVTRKGLWQAMNSALKGKQEGRYFLNPASQLVLVITDNPGEGKRLVTAYPAKRQFKHLAKAA